MTTVAEERGKPATEDCQRRTAFGLALDLDAQISVHGLSGVESATTSEPTRVRLDPEGVRGRWSLLDVAPLRTRELRAAESLLLTVDFAEPAGYLLWATGYGRVLISPDGRELLCDPEPANPDWTAILTTQALPLAATLRGFEVLHASGVVLRGRTVLLSGQPGAGKSSLAAALLLRGASLLSDDVVALEHRNGSLTAHPGTRALRLRPSERGRLSKDQQDALGAFTQAAGKLRHTPSAPVQPAPFGELFLLEHSALDPAIEHLDPIDPVALLATTFNLSVRTPERLVRHLDLIAALAETGRIYRLRVQPSVDATRLGELLDTYLAARSP
jgi:hypothetical protein